MTLRRFARLRGQPEPEVALVPPDVQPDVQPEPLLPSMPYVKPRTTVLHSDVHVIMDGFELRTFCSSLSVEQDALDVVWFREAAPIFGRGHFHVRMRLIGMEFNAPVGKLVDLEIVYSGQKYAGKAAITSVQRDFIVGEVASTNVELSMMAGERSMATGK